MIMKYSEENYNKYNDEIKKSKKFFHSIVFIIVLLFLAFVLSAVETLIVMAVWNFAIVPAFSAPIINFWQTFGILFLFDIILGIIKNR